MRANIEIFVEKHISRKYMKLTHTMQRESNVDSEWRYEGMLNRGKRDSKIHFGFFNKSDGN